MKPVIEDQGNGKFLVKIGGTYPNDYIRTVKGTCIAYKSLRAAQKAIDKLPSQSE